MRFGIIATIYTLFLDMLIFTTFAMRQNETIYEFNQRQQDIQVNYAVDAASWMMLYETPDIDIDYSNLNDIKVSPQIALETYEGIMVRGFGWTDDTFTRTSFETTYMPFLIVAAYDGYYIYGVTQEVDSHTLHEGLVVDSIIYPKQWTPKIPYAEFTDNNKNINIYHLGGNSYTMYSYDKDEYIYNILYSDKGGEPTNASTDNIKSFVSKALTDACQKCLVAAKASVPDEQIVIPASFSQWSSNRPIEYPTVLTYLDVSSENVQYNHVSFAIGGSRIEDNDYYIGYTYNGTKTYTHAEFRDVMENTYGVTVERIFTSAIDAAQSGYYYDLRMIR